MAKRHKVHVFTREFADIALKELDTISDFCRYLRAKEEIEDTAITILGGEENLLGKYIHEGRSFAWLRNADRVIIDDSVWPAIQAKPEVIKKRELDRISYGWDSLIDRAHEGSPQYERVARELARPDRFTRRMLAKTFSEAYSELVASDNDMMRRYSPVGDTTYCFLIVNDDEHPSKRRQLMLQQMCFVARSLPPRNSRVVGVATGRNNRSYDFLFLEMPIWGQREEELKNQLQKQHGIFVSPRITTTPEDEYPS